MSNQFMKMKSKEHALRIIAQLIAYQAPLKDQDAWLEAAIKLGFVEVGDEE